MAEASGLTLIQKDRLDPLNATTYGTGELIKCALDAGCKKIILGIGGSATNDGGAGMASALGVRFLNADGDELAPGGGYLQELDKICIEHIDKRIYETEIIVASDVTNPLCGSTGASAVFGPQKGATPEMVEHLDRSLSHYASKIKEQLSISIRDFPGSGAAGGLGGD
ncbi:Glycerate kinase [Halalkalibacter krulwichiae]|uniref:Glycerate kinase n=1 Tax=Halalkalibacter krulwichiae TaxID=199441 RepID=A0A1Y9THG2_9BACI|nr:Glycerate kinase [Halalkalibacter krulwichiae]